VLFRSNAGEADKLPFEDGRTIRDTRRARGEMQTAMALPPPILIWVPLCVRLETKKL